jgi:predicted RNA binding protein YcfA (HicA-like mRNA interferase family)
MTKLRTLSGEGLLRIFGTFGFSPVSHRGSHAKLRRVLVGGEVQTLTVVLHRELDKGTVRAIYRQALRFVGEEQLRPHFYTE